MSEALEVNLALSRSFVWFGFALLPLPPPPPPLLLLLPLVLLFLNAVAGGSAAVADYLPERIAGQKQMTAFLLSLPC